MHSRVYLSDLLDELNIVVLIPSLYDLSIFVSYTSLVVFCMGRILGCFVWSLGTRLDYTVSALGADSALVVSRLIGRYHRSHGYESFIVEARTLG